MKIKERTEENVTCELNYRIAKRDFVCLLAFLLSSTRLDDDSRYEC